MSTYFNAYIPLAGQDQDAPPVANDKFLIVCDGLGGDGSARHIMDSDGQGQKSAYLGSRKLSEICVDFFEENYEALLSTDLKKCIERLKVKINEDLTAFLTKYPKTEDSKGGMVFPTTLAAVVYNEDDEGVNATVIWAGDSRVYMLTEENSLQQLSKDDVVGEFDACFGKDCRMSNCISQDEPFFINYASYKLPKRCVIFACSDGCFDFTKSPMHFEMEILKALFDAKKIEPDDLKLSFETVMKKMNSGDDCTLSGVVFNYSSDDIKGFIRNRVKPLTSLVTDFKNAEQVYEKTTNEKRTEIRTLTSENKKLNQEIATQQRSLLLATFKEEINGKDELFKDKKLLSFSALLKSSYQPYADYLAELSSFSEKVKNNQKLVSDYKVVYERLKTLVDSAEREKRLKERKEKWGRNPIYNAGQYAGQIISSFGSKTIFPQTTEPTSMKRSECIMYIEELERLLSSIKQNVEGNAVPAVSEQLAIISNNIIRTLNEINAPASQSSFFDEKQRATILSEEELNKKVMPTVIKGGVAQYRGFIDESIYAELFKAFEEYKTIETLVSNINPAEEKDKTFDEKVRDFETSFLKVHLFKMTEFIINFDGVNTFVPALSQYQTNLEKLNAIQSDLDSGKDSQRQVWLKYKDNYEFYKTCSCIGEV